MSENLKERFEKNLQLQRDLCPGDSILVACSGGPDSVALLLLLAELRHLWRFKLGVIHFNHRLRKASRGDELFVKRLARRCKVRFLRGEANVKQLAKREGYSVEEAAREARYAFFRKISPRRFKKIVTGHTLNDQAETVLMRVFQGTGLRGLCGIRRSAALGDMTIVRPLLDFSKGEVLEYLKEKKAAFRKDSSNQSEKILRNRIRLSLIPWLEKNIQPRVSQAAARIPAILTEEAQWLESLEIEQWRKTAVLKHSGKVVLRRSRFLKHPAALQFRLLERALRHVDPKSGLSYESWKRLRPELQRRTYHCFFPKAVEFCLTPSKIEIYRKPVPTRLRPRR